MKMSKQRKFSRRQFLAMAGVSGTGLLVAACAPQGAPATQPPAPTEAPAAAPAATEVPAASAAPSAAAATVEVWWDNWGDLYNGLMTDIGTSYTKENPNTTIKWTFSPDYRQNLLTAIAAGTPPDCNMTRGREQTALAQAGAWMALDDLLAQAGYNGDAFNKSMWEQSVYEGKCYCVPGGADFNALYYNKDIFKEVGLDPEKPPLTAQELVDHSLKILQKDASGAIQRLGWIPGNWDAKQWGPIWGGRWFDDAAQKVTADDPKNIEMLNWVKAYTDQLNPDQLAAFNTSLPDFWSPGNSFASKKTAFRFDGYWTYDAMNQFAPDIDYGIAFWPTLKGTPEERANYTIEGWMVGIPNGAKQVAAGWDFLKYAFLTYSWKMGCDTLNGPCVNAQMAQFDQCTIDKLGPKDRMTPYLHFFSETGLAGTKHWPAIAVNALYTDEFNTAYDYIIRGEKTAEQAMAEVTKTVQAEYDKTMAG
jgi:multiple sugar transport system substrate-binding protein